MTEETQTSPAAESEEQSSRLLRLVLSIAALTLIGVVGVIVYGYVARPKPEWTGVTDKKFWDYLELLVVPAVLATGVFWLNTVQRERERKVEKTQRERDEVTENKRTQDVALEAYLDRMSKLLIEHDLIDYEAPDAVRAVARAVTLTLLPRLEGSRKGHVVRFWQQSGLLSAGDSNKGAYLDFAILVPIFDVRDADLSEADLSDAMLGNASLPLVDLHEANLRRATLTGVDLRGANLQGADLRGADLGYGYDEPFATKLEGANLEAADLREAKVSKDQLHVASSLKAAYMPQGQKYEEWLGTPDGQDWLRKYKKNLGAHKKETGKYESWIQTTEGQKWLKAIGEDGENPGPS